MKTIADWQKEIFAWAVEKGWWPMVVIPDPYDTFGDLGQKVDRTRVNIPEKLMLMVSELSEALEEYRNDKPFIYAYYHDVDNIDMVVPYVEGQKMKPEGLAIELADTVIRIMDFCAAYDINLEEAMTIKMAYNQTRPFKHGGKKC